MNFRTAQHVTAAGVALCLALISLVAVTPQPVFAQSNRYAYISPDNCFGTAATTAFDSQALIRAAAGNLVLNMDTNTTAGTVTVTCMVDLTTRLPGSGGTVIRDISLLYGVQVTALASIGAAVVNTVTYPASTAAGVAAAGTVAAAGGAITVTPTSLQLTTTTTGQCFNERLVPATPIQLADRQRLTVEQVFTTAGTTETILQVCGLLVHYTES